MNKKASGLLLCTLVFGNILSAVKIKPKQKRSSYFSRIQKQAAIGSMALVTIIGVIIGGYNLWPKKSVVAPRPAAPVTPDPVAPARVTPDPVAPAPVAPAPDPVAPARVALDPVAPDPVAQDPVAPARVVPARVTPARVTPDPVAPARVAPDSAPVAVAAVPARREPVAPLVPVPARVEPDPVVPARVEPDPVVPVPARREPVAAPPVRVAPVPARRAPALCSLCNLKPKHSGHDFCSRACAINEKTKANMCNYCKTYPKLKGHPFCSQTCGNSFKFQTTPVSTTISNRRVGIDGRGQRVTLYPFWHTRDMWDRKRRTRHSQDPLYPKTSDPAELGQCFSNWYVRPFSMNIDGETITFQTAEHALMFHKIWYATGKNINMAKQVLGCKTPIGAKKTAAKYTSDQWHREKESRIIEILTEKFHQHQDLMALLKSTGNGILVEASADDSEWGVGLDQNDRAILDQSKWKIDQNSHKNNLLGRTLMYVRDHN